MRSNGLTAPAYTPVADLDPVLATALLDDLKGQGVAAYTKPVESTTVSGFDRPEFRDRVKDRLYVDASAYARVRDLLSERDPHLLDDNDDLTWAQLVAGFDLPLKTGSRPWPEIENLAPGDDTGPGAATSSGGGQDDVVMPFTDRTAGAGGLTRSRPVDDPRTQAPDPSDDQGAPHSDPFDDIDFLASTSTTAARPDDDDEDRFVPDPPPPLPTIAPHRLAAWIGVVAGPLLLLVVAVFGFSPPGWLSFLGVIGFIGGFITLVATMGDDTDGDWGPDNGAVV